MNKRSDVKMKDKHNEAMLLMPSIFNQYGFETTVSHLPYINYGQPLDADFYTKRNIKTQEIIGTYNDKYVHEQLGLDEYTEPIQTKQLLERNILMFAIVETSIFSLRDIIYQNGTYWSTTDYTANAGVGSGTLGSYTALYYLPDLTQVTETGKTFTIMVNDLTHDPAWLQYPDYTADAEITEHGNNFFGNNSFKYYHVNAASYILLAKWFDYLRSKDLWDNTRIIIVSDHGDGGITHPDFNSFQNNHVLPYAALLLFKDFKSNNEIQTDTDFMTTADVPFLAFKALVEKPVNPFTGKAMMHEENGTYIFTKGYTNTDYYMGTTCLEDSSQFYHVHDSIFDSNNWQELQYKDFKGKE
jgi:hypothetical protein